jgi:hypothetical protein
MSSTGAFTAVAIVALRVLRALPACPVYLFRIPECKRLNLLNRTRHRRIPAAGGRCTEGAGLLRKVRGGLLEVGYSK